MNEDFPSCSLFNNLRILNCTNCEFSFVVNPPGNSELKEFYETVYRSSPSAYEINFTDRNPSPIDFRSMSQISLATQFIKFNPGDIFLDLGAGSGNSFQVAKTLLSEPILVSVESSSSANKYYSERFNVKAYSEIEEFNKQGYSAKIILLSHSLEHFRFDEVASILTQIGSALSTQGVCVIEVPAANLIRDRDLLLNDSPHLLFFSLKSLTLLLEKMNFQILSAHVMGQQLEMTTLSNEKMKKRLIHFLRKIGSKIVRLLDSSMITIDVSPKGSLFSNFIHNDKGSLIRVAISMK